MPTALHTSKDEGPDTPEESRRPRSKTRRIPMACYQCRERKIKCDRVIPCKNCSNRRNPEPCRYSPEAQTSAVTQTAEISSLRRQVTALTKKNQDFEAQLDASGGTIPSIGTRGRLLRKEQAGMHNEATSRHRLHGNVPALQQGDVRTGLTQPAPRSVDVYAYQDASAYPFSLMWDPTQRTPALTSVLPREDLLYRYVETFKNHSLSFGFPQEQNRSLTQEVDNFFSDVESHAEKHPCMLAFVFALCARGSWLLQCRQPKAVKEARRRPSGRESDVFLSAAKHALNLSSYTNRPSVLAVETLLLITHYLVDTGRFLDAFTVFGTTIRVAQMLGLHRDPRKLPNKPDDEKSLKRQSLWWWLLHIDTLFSITLGRPLGISAYGDCPPVDSVGGIETVHTVPSILSQFTVLCRQILGANNLTNTSIDHFTESLSDFIFNLPPSFRFSPQWLDHNFETPAWPANMQAVAFCVQINTYLVLLNRQWCGENPTSTLTAEPMHESNSTPPRDSVAYTRVITSCRAILQAFKYMRTHLADSSYDWSICQSAYNAAIVLANAMTRTKDFNDDDMLLIQEMCSAFESMSDFHDRYGILSDLPKKGKQVLRHFLTRSIAGLETDPQPDAFASHEEEILGGHGMILLEDPGLSDFYPEASNFSGLNWQIMNADHRIEPSWRQPDQDVIPKRHPSSPSSTTTQTPFAAQAQRLSHSAKPTSIRSGRRSTKADIEDVKEEPESRTPTQRKRQRRRKSATEGVTQSPKQRVLGRPKSRKTLKSTNRRSSVRKQSLDVYDVDKMNNSASASEHDMKIPLPRQSPQVDFSLVNRVVPMIATDANWTTPHRERNPTTLGQDTTSPVPTSTGMVRSFSAPQSHASQIPATAGLPSAVDMRPTMSSPAYHYAPHLGVGHPYMPQERDMNPFNRYNPYLDHTDFPRFAETSPTMMQTAVRDEADRMISDPRPQIPATPLNPEMVFAQSTPLPTPASIDNPTMSYPFSTQPPDYERPPSSTSMPMVLPITTAPTSMMPSFSHSSTMATTHHHGHHDLSPQSQFSYNSAYGVDYPSYDYNYNDAPPSQPTFPYSSPHQWPITTSAG